MRIYSLIRAIFLSPLLMVGIGGYSKDDPIAFSPTTALVIMDMQPEVIERVGSPQSKKNKAKLNQVLDVQKRLIQAADQAGAFVIVFEYQRPGRLLTEYEKTLPKLAKAVSQTRRHQFLLKSTDDVFDSINIFQKEWAQLLRKHQIDHLVFTGANGGACVKDSVQSALKKFRVTVVKDGVIDFNLKSFGYPYEFKLESITRSQHDRLQVVESHSFFDSVKSKNADCVEVMKDALGIASDL